MLVNSATMGHPPEPGSDVEEKLRQWEGGSRDDAVHEAAAAGLSIARIQKISGLGATTIMRILNKHSDRGRTHYNPAR